MTSAARNPARECKPNISLLGGRAAPFSNRENGLEANWVSSRLRNGDYSRLFLLKTQVVLPRSGGYWIDDGSDSSTASGAPVDSSQAASCKLELDETARCYRRFFMGKVSVPDEFLANLSRQTEGKGNRKVER